MDNREDIEILDDFDFDDDASIENINTNDTIDNESDATNKMDESNDQLLEEKKEQLENPVVEMINNKTTMKLIGIMLIVLFIAVFLMPKFFELIGNI